MSNVIDRDLNNTNITQLPSTKTGSESFVVKDSTVTKVTSVLFDLNAERAKRQWAVNVPTVVAKSSDDAEVKRRSLGTIGKVQFEERPSEDLLRNSIAGIMRGDQSFQNAMKLNATAVANDDADRFFRTKQSFPDSKAQQSANGAEIIASAFFKELRKKREEYVKKYNNWITDFTSRIPSSSEKTQSQIKAFLNKLAAITAQLDAISRTEFKAALYSTTNAIIARTPEGSQLEKFRSKSEFNKLIGISSPEQLKILPTDIQIMIDDFQIYMDVYLTDFEPGKKKKMSTKPHLVVVNASK